MMIHNAISATISKLIKRNICNHSRIEVLCAAFKTSVDTAKVLGAPEGTIVTYSNHEDFQFPDAGIHIC
jgi:hypothetical protein